MQGWVQSASRLDWLYCTLVARTEDCPSHSYWGFIHGRNGDRFTRAYCHSVAHWVPARITYVAIIQQLAHTPPEHSSMRMSLHLSFPSVLSFQPFVTPLHCIPPSLLPPPPPHLQLLLSLLSLLHRRKEQGSVPPPTSPHPVEEITSDVCR